MGAFRVIRQRGIVLPCRLATLSTFGVNTKAGTKAGTKAATAGSKDPIHRCFAGSPCNRQRRHNAEHRPLQARAVERQRPNGGMARASFFKNAFGQPSGLVQVGRKHDGMRGAAPP